MLVSISFVNFSSHFLLDEASIFWVKWEKVVFFFFFFLFLFGSERLILSTLLHLGNLVMAYLIIV